MPKLSQQQHRSKYEAAWADFGDRQNWQTSYKGNPWRIWGELRLVICHYRDDMYGWMIFEGDEPPEFSSIRFETVEIAIADLGEALDVGCLP
jgi:hypothetical protein